MLLILTFKISKLNRHSLLNNTAMIRTVVTPKNTDLHLLIPKDYVGKQIEVLLYTSEEVNEKK